MKKEQFQQPGNRRPLEFLTGFDYRDRGFERFLDETSPDVDAARAQMYFADKPCFLGLPSGAAVDWEFIAAFMRMLHE
jgi:hypothetical protein